MNSARQPDPYLGGATAAGAAAPEVAAADPEWSTRVLAMLDRFPAQAGRCRVLAIEGHSGAGKTVLAECLAARAGCPLLHLDDLYPGWEGLEPAVPLVREWVLKPLAAGEDPRWRRHDWERATPGAWQHTPVGDVLVIEGCGSGARELRPFLSLLAWVHAPEPVRAARLDAREDAADYAGYRSLWARQEDTFYTAHRPREHAGLVIANG